jgi:hypothetical protein
MVVCFVERHPPRLVLARLEPIGAVGEGARELIAGGALLARALGMGGAIRRSLAQARAELGGHPLTSGQLLVGLPTASPHPAIGRSRTGTRGRFLTRSSPPPQ